MLHSGQKENQMIKKRSPSTIKLTSEGGCNWRDEEKRKLGKQLRDSGGSSNIPLEEGKFLMNIAGKAIATYSPGIKYLASLPFATLLITQIANPASKLTGTTQVRRFPEMEMLKLTTHHENEAG